MTKFYGVYRGYKPGVYVSWSECKAQVNGFKGAAFKGFPTFEAAQIFSQTGGDSINPPKYYAVARGHQPGIYTTWVEAEDQIRGFHDARFKKFDTQTGAEAFMRRHSNMRRDEKIQLFHTHWADYENFTPKPNATFAEEFDRLASSQGWEKQTDEYRRQKVIAFRKDIEQHYFSQPDPAIKEEEEDEDEDDCQVCSESAKMRCPECRQACYCSKECIDKDIKHKRVCKDIIELSGYKNMCHQVGKPPGETVEECIAVLKGKPYVNIVDFVDCRRTGQSLQLWKSWTEFKRYTIGTPGKRIDLEFAKKDKFLAGLLQDFNMGPDAKGINFEFPPGINVMKVRPGKDNERVLKRGVGSSGVMSGRVDKTRRAAPSVRVTRNAIRARPEDPESDEQTDSDNASMQSDDESEQSNTETSYTEDDLRAERESCVSAREELEKWRLGLSKKGKWTSSHRAQHQTMMKEIERREDRCGL